MNKLALLCLVCCSAAAITSPGVRTPVPAALRQAPAVGEAVLVRGLEITPGEQIDLALRRFTVDGPGAEIVVRRGGTDRPARYDPSSVVLLGGEVEGAPGSEVFIAHAPSLGFIGRIDDGSGRAFSVAPAPGPSAALLIAPMGTRGAGLPAPLCGTATGGWSEPEMLVDDFPADYLVEVAVDTDYEFFEMVDDENRALDYLFVMYGQASYVCSRDSGIRLVLSFTRIWTDPDDLFNSDQPLSEFRGYWNLNMDHVERDVAQLVSGRRDYAFGGQAFLSQVCTDRAYSVCGYMGAGLGEVDVPSHLNGDTMVASHELGHNFGAPHTHDRDLDDCADPFAPPQRGPIMSYCGQTYSGGDANHDLRFHTDSTRLMREYLATRLDCLDADCNANAIADAIDIADGTSEDANGNGVPDECEDCNGNGVFDDEDIAGGTSLDLNNNGVPDECEPDCNDNGVPDDLDIALGDALDGDANGVPDECQADCDGNGIADSLDINADMSLDIDRDGVLDGCQDCDGDGVNDLAALGREWNVWVGSLQADVGVGEFFGETGVRVGLADDAGIEVANDLVITPDRRILVASALDDRIVEFAPGGSYVRDLVAPGAGGLDSPGGMLIVGESLLVASQRGIAVLEFDLATGAFVRVLVETTIQPFGLAEAPGGGILVTLDDDSVVEIDYASGEFRRVVVDPFDNGGLDDPRGLVVDPIGRLLVCSPGSNEVLAYDLASGEPLGRFNRNGVNNILSLESPWAIRVGPNGNVFVSNSDIHGRVPPDNLHLTQARIYEFDYHFGNYLRALVQGADSGLWRPSGFDFMPGGAVDCNMNFFPDSCEIAMGLVEDLDGDGVPDECQACDGDIDGDRDADADDFFGYLDLFAASDPRADVTGSADPRSRAYGVPDGQIDAEDFFVYLDSFAAGC